MKHLPAAGIDLGKQSFSLSYPEPDTPARHWPVLTLEYKDERWPQILIDLLAPAAPVVAEPTGMNLIAPIAKVLRAFTTSPLYVINHAATGRVRAEHVSRTKTDDMDARALALIATWVGTPAQIISLRPYLHNEEEATAALRLYIDSHRRMTKQRTAAINRLHALGFSLWPQLSFSLEVWLTAITAGAITPAQIINLAADPPDHWHGNTARAINRLAAKLPAWHGHPATISAITRLHAEITALDNAITENSTHITAIIEQPPFANVTAIWRTVPASSDVAIATLHAATHGQINSYTDRQFSSAIGTNPQGKKSGTIDKTKRSRSGYKPAAAQIHLWTMRLIKAADNPIYNYYQKTHSSHALAASRNKLAKILWICATRKEPCKW
jgi:hypothetical protein